MNLNHLQVFVKIVESGSLTRAASALHLPKSSVSRILSSLEKETGILLHRTTREIRLTQWGIALFEKASGPLAELRLATESLNQEKNEVDGLLRITAPMDLGFGILPGILSRFQTLEPKVKIDILLSQNNLDLVRDSVDIAIRMGKLEDSSLRAIRVGYAKLILVASPQFLQSSNPKKIHDLERLPTLSFVGKNKSLWNLFDGKNKVSLKIQPGITANDPWCLLQLALEHRGIALLPEFLCENALKKGILQPLFRNWKSESAPVHLVHPYKKQVPLRVRRFMDYLSAELTKVF